jgi:hypothetical protein
MGPDAQERGRSTTVLCVWVFINPVLDANQGDIFRESSRGQSPCQSALRKELTNSHCALVRPTNQLVTCVIYLSSINLHALNLAEALS